MKKITFLITILVMFSGYAQHVPAYTRTVLTEQTYTPITGGTVINDPSVLVSGLWVAAPTQDDGAVIVTLPFAFKYSGGSYTQATFCTNGWVGFSDYFGGTALESRTAANVFTAASPNNILAAWYGDLGGNFPTGVGSMVHGLVGTDVYAFEWQNAVSNGFTQNAGTNVLNFMIKIYGPASTNPGRIEYLYGSTTGTVSVTTRSVGLEGDLGGPGDFLNGLNGSTTLTTTATAWPGNGNGFRFDPSATPCSGTVTTGVISVAGGCSPYISAAAASIPATGIVYQWEQSTDGGTVWANVSGGTANARSYYPPAFTTPIKYRLKVTCGASTETSNAVDYAGIAAPSTQTSGLTVVNGSGQFTLNWTNGNGARRMVIVSDTPISDPTDVTNSPTITGAAAYLGGQQVVYDNTGSTVTVTGIPCTGGTYYIKVYEYTRCGVANDYTYIFNTTTGTNIATQVVAPVAAPTTQVSALALTYTSGQVVASWTNGNGLRRMVLVDTSPIPDQFDFTGAAPVANTVFQNNGPQVVFDNTGTTATVTVTGLSCAAGDVYYVKVFEYNRCGVTGSFEHLINNTTGTNAATLNIAAPTTQVSNLITGTTYSSATLNWVNGNGNNRMVIVSDSPIVDPVDASGVPAPTGVSAVYAGGQQIVYNGTGSTVTVTGLSCSNTTYFVKVYEYYRCGTTPNFTYTYNVTSGTNIGTIGALPVTTLPQATSFAGFTGANLAGTSPNWFESKIAMTAGSTPTNTNPVGAVSDWTSSTVLGGTTAKLNLTGAVKNDWIISPKMAITAATRVKLKAAITAAASAAVATNTMSASDDAVSLLISTDGCGGSWTPLHVFSAASVGTLSNSLVDYSFLIDGPYIGQTVQIAFQGTSGPLVNTGSYDFHIGNVIIELVPDCDTPSVITDPVSLITENGATVAWGMPGTTTPTGYEYVFATTNVAPATAGTYTSNLSATITTLTASTQYFTWVRTTCGTLFSNWVMVGSFRTLCDAPDLLSSAGGSRCGAGTVELSASTTPGSTISWYAAETGGAPLASGNTYSPTVSATTTYYVGASTASGNVSNAGMPAPSGTATFETTNWGIVFDVVQNVNINTVEIYSATAGTVNIAITTSAGVELFSTGNMPIVAGATVPNAVPINFSIAPGTGYKMIMKAYSGVSLVRELTGATFPHNGTDGNLNVVGSWTTSVGFTTYYWFYNVRYTAGCQSLRTPVIATVTPGNTPTGATSQTVTANTAEEATIEDIVVTESGVIWYATEAEAIAGTPALAAGTQLVNGTTYYGTLSTGSCAPLAVTINVVLSNKGFDKSQFSYYPNPVKDALNLKYSNEISGVEVYNLVGQKIMSKTINANEVSLDMSVIADGNYIVRVTSGNTVETLKIVKKN